jgi:hypothetical protein
VYARPLEQRWRITHIDAQLHLSRSDEASILSDEI